MRSLKKKVLNKARVEGSICEAYIIEEISDFCSLYFEDSVMTKRNKVLRNDDGGNVESSGRLSIFCQRGCPICTEKGRWLSQEEVDKAHLYVLLNCPEITPYVQRFDDEICTMHPAITDEQLQIKRDATFAQWLKQLVNDDENCDPRIIDLANYPTRLIERCKAYNVNGFKFHTHEYSKNKSTTNSGVCVKGDCYNEYGVNFYDVLKEIFQLEYRGDGNKLWMFNCDWFDNSERGMKVDRNHRIIDIRHKSRLQSDEPFILAYQAQQVYYTKYPSHKKERMEWITVCKVKVRNSVPLEDGMVQAEITTPYYYQEDNMAVELNLHTDINDTPYLLDAGINEYIDPSEIHDNEDDDNEFNDSTENDDDEHDDDEEEQDYDSSDN